jgi:hypothetical protein
MTYRRLTEKDYSDEELRLLEQKFRTKLQVNQGQLNSSYQNQHFRSSKSVPLSSFSLKRFS